jgi:S-phase kinase-associated protein 1
LAHIAQVRKARICPLSPPLLQPLTSTNMGDLVQAWFAQFITAVDIETLFQLISAANYLDLKPLLDLSCAAVAAQIKGKTTEEIRSHFSLVNDFTAAEEAQVKEEMRWCDVAA